MTTSKNLNHLSPEQIRVTQHEGTEAPFTNKFCNHNENGLYLCVCCQNPLFSSNDKYDSGTGWPSFRESLSDDVLLLTPDYQLGYERTELKCKSCNAHLGHLFLEGRPLKKRYCINSASLAFKEQEK